MHGEGAGLLAALGAEADEGLEEGVRWGARWVEGGFTLLLKSWSGLKVISYLTAPQRQPPATLDGVDMLVKCKLDWYID